MIQFLIHYSLHLLAPLALALLFFKPHWKRAYLIMLAAMLIDLDHLLVDPVFDPNRCSIGFHPLHSYWATAVYLLMLFWRPLQILGIGLLLHLFADAIDCLMM